MMVFKILTLIGLALWVGALALFIVVVAPITFRSFPKEDAARFMGMLFPAVDRWSLIWGGVTCGSMYLVFMGRHLAWRSLALELPSALMLWGVFHCAFVLHPQIRELKRKLALPEFRGTAHKQTIQFAFNNLHKRSGGLYLSILVVGLLLLGLFPRWFLRP